MGVPDVCAHVHDERRAILTEAGKDLARQVVLHLVDQVRLPELAAVAGGGVHIHACTLTAVSLLAALACRLSVCRSVGVTNVQLQPLPAEARSSLHLARLPRKVQD